MKILMLAESLYPLDVRVRQEALRLTEDGHEVTVVALKEKDERFSEMVESVRVYRVPKIELFAQGKHNKLSSNFSLLGLLTLVKAIVGYGFEFVYFTVASYLMSWIAYIRHGFDVIHSHNPPDTLFLVALLWKPLGKKYVFDHHDLSPDLFFEKYGSRNKFVYKVLLALERASCKLADIVIATNESYKRIEIERCDISPHKIYVVRNGPDLREIKASEPIESIRSKARTILCYLGAINVQDGLDYLLRAMQELVFTFNYRDVLLLIIGDGDYLPQIRKLAQELDLNNHILFTGRVTDRKELCRLLSTADIFVDAAPKSFLNDSSTFIKHMEYMIFGKPVVSFELKESMYSLDGAGVFAKPNDTYDMAKKILELIGDEDRRAEIGKIAKKRVKALAWQEVSKPLLEAYRNLQAL